MNILSQAMIYKSCFFSAGKSKKRDQCKNHQLYPLSETQYCPCNKYNAQPVGNWSDCILSESSRMEGQLGMKVQGDIKECGQGYRYQSTVCYDQDNRIVETSRCNSHGEFNMAMVWFTPNRIMFKDCKCAFSSVLLWNYMFPFTFFTKTDEVKCWN